MPNISVYSCWLAIMLCLIICIQTGGSDEIGLDLNDLPLANYITEVKAVTPNTLKGWFKMTNGFLSAVHSNNKRIVDLLLEFVKGKNTNVMDIAYSMLKLQYAMFACIIIGLLFIIAMWTTGLIFFCCRMCGNCGGKKVQIETSNTSIWRKAWILSLLVFTALLIPVPIIIIQCSSSTSVEELEKSIGTTMYDSEIFINNSYNQVEYLAVNGITKAQKVIFYELDNIETFIRNQMQGGSVVDGLKEAGPLFVAWKEIAFYVEGAFNGTVLAEMSVKKLEKELLVSIKENLAEFKKSCNEKCKEINPDAFTLVNSAENTKNTLKQSMDSFAKLDETDYEGIAPGIVKEFKDIPSTMSKKTLSIRSDVKKDVQAFSREILFGEDMRQLQNFTELARNKIQDGRHFAQKAFQTTRPYDKYRWYGDLTVSIIIAIVVVGLLLGLLFGMCGYRSHRQATKRTAMSSGGGYMLMFAVYWMFLFSGFLMLITTALFAAGGVVEVYFCRPFFDEKFEFFDQVMGTIQHTTFNESNIIKNVVPSKVLRSCANNETLYVVFNLESLNLKSKFDYKKKLKLDQRLKEMEEIKPPSLLNDHSKNAIAALIKVLSVPVSDDLITASKDLIILCENQTQILSEMNDPKAESFLPYLQKLNINMQALVGGMEEQNLTVAIEGVINGSEQLKGKLQMMMKMMQSVDVQISDISKEISKRFVDKLVIIGDSLVDNIMANVEQKLAPCKPLWNMFDSSRTAVCINNVQPLNGIWFAIGWGLFFFIPLIIVSTKLSKHFFKMSHVASSEKSEKGDCEMEHINGYKVKSDNGWPASAQRF